MEEQEKKDKEILPSENQGIEAYLNQIKLISFNVLFVLLKEEEEGENILVKKKSFSFKKNKKKKFRIYISQQQWIIYKCILFPSIKK